MFNWIKKWWENLPDANSGKFQLDKQIVKSTLKNLWLLLLGSLGAFIYGLQNGESIKSAGLVFIAGMGTNILNVLIKLWKDYTKIETAEKTKIEK